MTVSTQQNATVSSPSHDFRRVAALGHASGGAFSSIMVAKQLFPSAEIVGAETFEEAASLMRSGNAEALLIPGAYPHVKKFLMFEELRLAEATKHGVPALVATAIENDSNRYLKLFYHHAISSLLDKIDAFHFDEAIEVSSNIVAVERMLENPMCYAAVTIEEIALAHRLPTRQVLRADPDMAWLLFVNRQ